LSLVPPGLTALREPRNQKILLEGVKSETEPHHSFGLHT